MRFLKYLVPLWVALMFYAISSFFWGGVGLSAYKQLSKEYENQLKNISSLQEIATELNAEKAALTSDDDTINAYLRNLGYGAGDEHFIRIVGFNEALKQKTESGEVYQIKAPTFIEDKKLCIISVVIFVFMSICILFVDALNFIRRV